MPILEPVTDPTSDLAQGDVLKGINLVWSVADPKGEPEASGAPETVLVVSRDCAVEHKNSVLVAPIKRYQFAKPDVEGLSTLESAMKMLATVRDGYFPDTFYLGTIPGETLRSSAKLDSVMPLIVPTEIEARRSWIGKVRVARLSEDFRRALPVRFFWALAKIGFDDSSWYCTDDLKLVLGAADLEMATLKKELAAAQLSVSQFSATGETAAKKLDGLTKAVEASQAKVKTLEGAVEQLQSELEKRK